MPCIVSILEFVSFMGGFVPLTPTANFSDCNSAISVPEALTLLQLFPNAAWVEVDCDRAGKWVLINTTNSCNLETPGHFRLAAVYKEYFNLYDFMSTNLPKAQGELNRAKDDIEQMKNASGFEVYEKSWSDFLNHLDKAWNKASAETLSVPKAKFDPFKGQYVNKRKSDQLLKYLDQARNSDTHSVQEIIEQQPETIIIGPAEPNTFIDFKSITIDLCEKTVSEYDGPAVQADFIPPCIHAIAVTNHGTTFQPPVEHFGVPLTKEKDPVEIAELGLAFYQGYLDAIEAKFFS